MALTGKILAYLATDYAFIFLALLFRASWLTVFVLPMAVLIFASFKLPKLQPLPIDVARRIRPKRSMGDEDVEVTLTVTNISPHPIEALQFDDNLPYGVKLKSGTNRLMLSLGPGEVAELKYTLSSPKRGRHELGPTLFVFKDNLRLRSISGQLSNVDELLVLPKIENLGTVDLRGRRVGPWPGLVPSRRMGIGTEFFELAPYIPGDDLRRVNWKASARSRQLVTNEFEGEQVVDVLVVLDCSEGVLSDIFDYDLLEFQVRFAASLCSQLIMQGNRVGLSIYGAVRTWLDLAFGKRQLLRILDSLAIVRPGAATLPIRYVVESVVSAILPARSLVLLISPMIGDDVPEMIENIATKGYSTICFTPSIGTAPSDLSDSSRIARRIFAAERRLRINNVKHLTRVIEISPTRAIKPSIRMRNEWKAA
ncbi:MAG TPA: DUF58 domain-containing protein [Candidatus Acidoferrales bacterium]|nr:DUF58 domain-containing protein [Candidatus Acidoferrales bacterium]